MSEFSKERQRLASQRAAVRDFERARSMQHEVTARRYVAPTMPFGNSGGFAGNHAADMLLDDVDAKVNFKPKKPDTVEPAPIPVVGFPMSPEDFKEYVVTESDTRVATSYPPPV